MKKRSIAEDESAAFMFSVSPAPRGLRPPVTRLINRLPPHQDYLGACAAKQEGDGFDLASGGYVSVNCKDFEDSPGRGVGMWLLVLLALIAALFVGLGFVVKWLFIVAVVLALVWLIAFFAGGLRRA